MKGFLFNDVLFKERNFILKFFHCVQKKNLFIYLRKFEIFLLKK